MPTDKQTLTHQLNHLGLNDCRLLMAHASMRAVGPVEDGATGLIDAILAAMGPGGTLVQPLGADDSDPFDKDVTPTEGDLGVFAEIFRTRAGTKVNDHAAARFGAIGPLADEILEPMPLHHYYDEGSPLSRFVRAGGRVLRLGADIDTVTATHYAEYLADVPDKRHVSRRYERADTGEQWIDSLDDVDGIAVWGGGDYFPQILIDFLETGAVRTGPVGGCRAELFRAGDFVPFAVRWMETNLGGMPGQSEL